MACSFDIALAFCPADVSSACRLMHWIVEIGTPKNAAVVLIPSVNCSVRYIWMVYRAASAAFHDVRVDVCELPDAPWPVGPNRMFEWAGRRLRRPFLWLEPDCVPLHGKWLEELDAEFRGCGKPVLSDWYDAEHSSGIAIYTPSEARALAAIGDQRQAWDSREPEFFRSISARSAKIQHIWGQKNIPPTFTTFRTGKPGSTTIALVRPGAALFHRCKDGSLMKLLRPGYDVRRRTRPAMQDRGFVQLGRYGDIINLLPVWRDMHAHGIRPNVIVSEQFADVFDGVRYVQPIPVKCGPYDLQEGIRIARERFKDPVVTQVYGTGLPTDATTEHFNMESWKRAGYLPRFWDPCLRLVFDRRDYRRERALVERFIVGQSKPVVLLNLSGGVSSRFPGHADFVREVIQPWEDRIHFVDIASVQCARIYDLSGLLEVADGLVTIDTATLHLAGVSGIEVLALLSEHSEWLRSAPRCSVAWSAPSNEWERHRGAIEQRLSVIHERKAKVVHVYERHGELNAREQAAQATWNRTGWTLRAYDRYVRDARSIRDNRDLPFLKDILARGMEDLDPWDIVVFTNSDIALRDGIDGELRSLMRSVSICTSRRMDHDNGGNRAPYAGRDLVAFRVGWLRHHFNSIPDFLVGASHWDLWAMIQARVLVGNGKTDWKDLEVDSPECELPPGLCEHQRHASRWLENEKSPSEIHNRALYNLYAKGLKC